MGYTIKELSEMTGIPFTTMRYYDKEGLLPYLKRSESGYWIFRDMRKVERYGEDY